MGTTDLLISPSAVFWLSVYAISLTVLVLGLIGFGIRILSAQRSLTWDMHTEYIDITEFSNKNIPLRVTYKGIEPRWLWATYLSLRNTGRFDVSASDSPEKQHLIVGNEGCRYIGFNRLTSHKAKVTLSPLFKGNDVYCRIEFDRLGPGDEILLSLLFIADEKNRVQVEGALFGAGSRLIDGYTQRMQSWRSLWWLLIAVIGAGTVGGLILLNEAIYHQGVILWHFQTLLIMYLVALITAAVFLRPIRFWQQIPERFHQAEGNGESARGFWRLLKFILGITNEP